jgi:cytochrome P450
LVDYFSNYHRFQDLPTGTRVPTGTTMNVKSMTAPLRPVTDLVRFFRDPLGFLRQLSTGGDLVRLKLLTADAVFLNDPDLIDQVLVRNCDNYTKSDPFWRAMRALMGESVATGEGPGWAAQRRPIQQVFDRHNFDWSTPLIAAATEEMVEGWTDREVFDVSEQMRGLNLRVGARLISGTDDATSQAFGEAFETWHTATAEFARFPFPPLNWPSPRRTRVRKAEQVMDDSLFWMLVQRARSGGDGMDVLSQLLAGEEQAPLANPKLLRDNIMSLRLGTYENQSTTLSWAWHWLTTNPELLARAVAEAEQVLGDDSFTAAHLPRLEFTTAVLRETLRLSPSIWLLMRQADGRDRLGGHEIAPGTVMIMSPYTVQRDPRYWPDPLVFDPDRFLDRSRPVARQPYLPFGKGPHTCLASNFAFQQMVVIMATVLRRFNLAAASRAPMGEIPLVAMRPSRPVLVTARARVRA